MTDHTTLAKIIAAKFNDDGQQFHTAESEQLEDVLRAYGANADRSGDFADDPVAYRLPDGSAIVTAGDGWDLEGVARYSWAGA